MSPKNKVPFDNRFKVQSNEAGTQRIDARDLENDPAIQQAIKRLYHGYVAEQEYRASLREVTRGQAVGAEAERGKALDAEILRLAEDSEQGTTVQETLQIRNRVREAGESDS